MSTLLGLHGLSKSWFGVPAVTDMHLEVSAGICLGIIGENGAGKSTLMNMIGGVVPPSAGGMTWRGEVYAPKNPAEAKAHGIAFIHQELNLFTNLSVAENIFIDGFPYRFGLIDKRFMAKRSQELLERLNLKISPDTSVGTLAPGERQLVEIAKALHREAAMIIFDEPTTSLTARETEKLFETINTLKNGGTTIAYISHILSDVQALSDEIAVLRDGHLVARGPIGEFDVPAMINAMIGRELSAIYPPRTSTPSDQVILEANGLSQAGVVEDICFKLHKGEILGLFGLMGAGRSELARMIFGIDPTQHGTLLFNDVPIEGNARARIAKGMAFVTENRREEGLMMDAAIADNLSLVTIEQFGRPPLSILDQDKLTQRTQDIRKTVTIKAGNIATQAARALSGGNQQKVVIGKWLLGKPQLFILDEPTRGVDVGAKHEIYAIIDSLAAAGSGVLLISSELEELMGTCDRIMVMAQGEITGVFAREDYSEAAIIAAAFKEMAA